MPRDDIPEDLVKLRPCHTPSCVGNLTQARKGVWKCDRCDFNVDNNDDDKRH